MNPMNLDQKKLGKFDVIIIDGVVLKSNTIEVSLREALKLAH